ncbi:MAG: hypothetical protein JNL17_04965 [Cyclobacteriaceae bacterium]|nr:hypothetical protein [Cyclobacteriaceae bacterium]
MKIKHKLTGDEIEVSRLKWDDEYLPKRLEDVYDIIEEDSVLVRKILDNGDRKPYRKFDRDHALRMVKSNPMKYDFIEIELTEDEKLDIILRELNNAYPGYLYVIDYANQKFNSSTREEQIFVDRLREDNLAKSLGNPDHRMQITTKGIKVVQNGGYLKWVKDSQEKGENERTAYQPDDKFTDNDRDAVSEKLDELSKKLERLEMGQKLIYDDIIDEIEELKTLTKVLGKKNWTETLKGKFIQWGLGELSDKGIELIIETFKDEKLLKS